MLYYQCAVHTANGRRIVLWPDIVLQTAPGGSTVIEDQLIVEIAGTPHWTA